jgi:hypothetical protein
MESNKPIEPTTPNKIIEAKNKANPRQYISTYFLN